MNINSKVKKLKFTAAALAILLAASAGANILFLLSPDVLYDSYLQDTGEIGIMESGILYNNSDFSEGEDVEITYDFDHPSYPALIEKYRLRDIAGEGSEFDKALRLMDEFAPRLRHLSDYDNHIDMNADALLDYSLDDPSHGINCRAKAQILNEMCLALGIYSRKVWLMPYSSYDSDCHVVNEVWDSTLKKWVMLDITNDEYWIDGSGVPLSVFEIREKGALNEFSTPVRGTEKTADPEKLRRRHNGDYLYIMKNMCYFEYLDSYSAGEDATIWLVISDTAKTDYEYIMSEESAARPPM